jgi:hypothetical protein
MTRLSSAVLMVISDLCLMVIKLIVLIRGRFSEWPLHSVAFNALSKPYHMLNRKRKRKCKKLVHLAGFEPALCDVRSVDDYPVADRWIKLVCAEGFEPP